MGGELRSHNLVGPAATPELDEFSFPGVGEPGATRVGVWTVLMTTFLDNFPHCNLIFHQNTSAGVD